MDLPVDAILDDVRAASRGCVVVAPPGSGKTTRVPPALLEVVAGTVLLLQPRRVAARRCAARIAHERGERLGETIGYRVRFDSKVSSKTRLEVLTEGLLTRRLQSDPFLEGVDAVVLDEFHERSLHADLGLALLREVAESRPLRIVVMSATMDPEPVARFLGGVPVLRAEGRVFPVEVEHSTDALTKVVRRVHGAGHTLVFQPGVRDIERTCRALSDLPVFPLHGRLPAAAQDRALAPSSDPKIVVATNIAETSVTLPGVRTVVDSGRAKVPRFDAGLGVDRLEETWISQASADQRAGRAGRTGPGRAIRMWARTQSLAPFEEPAIVREELTSLLVQLLAWGVDPREFAWFERPPETRLDHALSLIQRMGDPSELVRYPLHPRYAACLIAGASASQIACLAERQDVRRVAKQLVRIGARRGADDVQALLAGFPDRVARRRGERRYQLATGRGVTTDDDHGEWIIALDISGARKGERAEDRVRVAVDIEGDWLDVTEHPVAGFDPETRSVRGHLERRVGAIVLARHPAPVPPELAAQTLAQHATLDDLRLGKEDRAWLARIEWLDDQRADLHLDLPALLEEQCLGKRSLKQLDGKAFLRRVRQSIQGRDSLAPARFKAPGGASLPIRYEVGRPPVISGRIQKLFGLERTPEIAGVACLIELLAPNGRPAQITRDIAGFWGGTYADVRKDLRGRYPKHAWPEVPTLEHAWKPRRR
ncbi:MAG: ATP-dependent RNA helicase [Proteobacteria bacterium]|nr:ATP-dependent RNA helicase [Pseudomonadota bacterium]MCP4921314.1 ATP-dependent RNA helicase [Pseudomonadota bacterium]